MKIILMLSILLFGCTAPTIKVAARNNIPGERPEKPIVVVVIDTGFGYKGIGQFTHLCKRGHRDFTNKNDFIKIDGMDPIPQDNNSHGTHIIGLIEQYSKVQTSKYCVVVVKYYNNTSDQIDYGKTSLKSLKYAISIGAKIINYSGGGLLYIKEEVDLIKKFLDKGGIFVAAAGNDGTNLDEFYNRYYPAQSDPRVIVVGNISASGKRSRSSNYGKDVKYWEVGEMVESYGMVYSGTSMSTAIKTGKIITGLVK